MRKAIRRANANLTLLPRHPCIPPVAEGFALYINAPNVAQATAAHLATVLKQSKSNVYDTHPPLSLRVAAARALPIPAITPDDASALSLVGNVDALELQLLPFRFPQLKQEIG